MNRENALEGFVTWLRSQNRQTTNKKTVTITIITKTRLFNGTAIDHQAKTHGVVKVGIRLRHLAPHAQRVLFVHLVLPRQVAEVRGQRLRRQQALQHAVQ